MKVINIIGLCIGSERVVVVFEDESCVTQHQEDSSKPLRISKIDGVISKHMGADVIKFDTKIIKEEHDSRKWKSTLYTMLTDNGILEWKWSEVK